MSLFQFTGKVYFNGDSEIGNLFKQRFTVGPSWLLSMDLGYESLFFWGSLRV